jgi:hypothetical protein
MSAVTMSHPYEVTPSADHAPTNERSIVAADMAGSKLLKLSTVHESAAKQRIFFVMGIVVAIGFFLLCMAFFAPAPGQPGVDENAYLVGGKNLAQTFSPGIHPSNPFAYVGPMWVRSLDGSYYPKYPVGVPLLNAIAIWTTGEIDSAYYVSPICGALAVAAMFFFTRMLAGSFLGVLAALALATNATMLHLSLTPSSHAPAICFALWGMVALLYWLKTGKIWRGLAAGLLLGFTVTLRYTEGLLVLPLAAAVLFTVRWKNWRSYGRAALPIIAWTVPVLVLVIHNRLTTGQWTGYDSSNESVGFSIANLVNKWETTTQQLYVYGLFFLLPLGVLGMTLMFARSWKIGLILVLWFVPSLVLYTAYYWGGNTPGFGYLRFFLTIFPPIIAAAMWFMGEAGKGLLSQREGEPRGSVAIPLGTGLFTAMVTAVSIFVAAPALVQQRQNNLKLAYTADEFLRAVPAAQPNHHQQPIVFAENAGMSSPTLMHLQFAGNAEWYASSAFTPEGGRRMGRGPRPGGFNGPTVDRLDGPPGGGLGGPGDPGAADQDTPSPMDPERAAFQRQLYEKMSAADLSREERKFLSDALSADRQVYAVLTPASATEFRRRMTDHGFIVKTIANWTEPSAEIVPSDSGDPSRRQGGRPDTDRRGARGPGFGGQGGPSGGRAPSTGLALPIGPGRGGPSAQNLQVLQVTRNEAANSATVSSTQ